MSQPRLAAIAILGLSTVTAAGIAYHQYQRAEALTQALADRAESPSLPVPRQNLDSPTLASSDDESVARSDSDDDESEVEETANRDRDNGRGRFDRSAFGNRMQTLMSDPEYAQAFQKQQRARLDGPYAELFAQLNLPPAALSQLQNLLVEKQNAARDVFMAAREEGLGGRENRDQLRELLQLTQEEIDSQIRETIGDQNFETLQAYEQTAPQRAVVDQLETRLSYSGTPLNTAQADALTTILAETATVSSQGRSRGGPDLGPARSSVTITDDTITRAQGVLATDQLQSLVDIQQEQAAAQELAAIMRREAQAARSQSASGGENATPTRPGGGG